MAHIRLGDVPPEVRRALQKLDQDRTEAIRQAEDARRKREAAERLRARRVAYLERLGLPRPTTEHFFHPTRQWRFDFAWLKEKVALEVHGATWAGGHHSRGKGQQDDWEKLNEAQLLGWRVFQCSPKQVDSGAIFETLKKAVDQCQAREND